MISSCWLLHSLQHFKFLAILLLHFELSTYPCFDYLSCPFNCSFFSLALFMKFNCFGFEEFLCPISSSFLLFFDFIYVFFFNLNLVIRVFYSLGTFKIFENKVFIIENVGGACEVPGEVNMNPTCNLLNVESMHLPFDNNLSLENDDVNL